MARVKYPGNHTESEILNVPRHLKTRSNAPTTHLAYITDDEATLLKKYKPGTPHKGPHDIPNYDTWGIDQDTGAVTGGSTAGGGGAWSGDPGGNQPHPNPMSQPGAANLQAALSMASAGISGVGGTPLGPGEFNLTNTLGVPVPGLTEGTAGEVFTFGEPEEDPTNIDDLIFNQDVQDDQGATRQNYYGNYFGFGDSPYDLLLGQGLSVGDMLEHEGAETVDPESVWKEQLEALSAEESGPYADFLKGEFGVKNIGETPWNFDAQLNPRGDSTFMFNRPLNAEGGLASLANPHVDRREDVIPPMMSEGEFLGRGGRDQQRAEDYRRILDRAMGRMGQAQMRKPSPPFGATRENELDQLRAWENAPHHVDPPNIGFKGEKIPAPLYNRIMKYLEGVSPAERTLLDELINREGLKNFKEKFFDMKERKNIQPIEV